MMIDQPWAKIKRADGRIEQLCEHDIGHTISSPRRGKYELVHGCDGCCFKIKKPKLDARNTHDDRDADRLEKALSEIIYDSTMELSDGVWGAEITIEQIVFCEMDKEDESVELATTHHTFIARVIVDSGKAMNRYKIIVNPRGAS